MKKMSMFVFTMLLASVTVLAQGYKIGDKVADFKLKNVDGKWYR